MNGWQNIILANLIWGPRMDYVEWRKGHNDFFTATPNGESLFDAKKRIGRFLYDLENKYSNETILFVAHGIVFEVLPSIVNGYDAKETWDKWREELLSWAEFREYPFVSLPHNENYELDLHRPYIDEIELVDKEENKLKEYQKYLIVGLSLVQCLLLSFIIRLKTKKNLKIKRRTFPGRFYC